MGDTAEIGVLQARANGVLTITLNRPEALNAITWDQRMALVDIFEEASADLSVRAIVLTATGRGFCAGADLRAPRPTFERPADAPRVASGEVARSIRTGAQRLINAIMDCDKPVIAAVNGIAAGMGCHVAFACDLIVASSSAKFIEVFTRRGLVPDAGAAYLVTRMIGPHRTKQLFLFADDLPAADALAMGMVNAVVEPDELMATATAWAERLAVGPTRAYAMAKGLVNRALDVDRATAFVDEAYAQDMNMASHDGPEGVSAFVERREPQFKGW